MTDLTILKGKTFSRTIRWSAMPFIYKPITAITKASPVSITATGHGLVSGWRAAVVSAGGMRQINAKYDPPRTTDFHKVTVTDANTITLNTVNSAGFSTYTSGGSLVYYTPVSLAAFTARMMIRATAESTGTPLESLTTENGGIALDDTNHTITITITATMTAAYTWVAGVYDLELVSSGGVVTQLLSGNVTTVDEVTR